jgi:hypothetical protein
VSVLLEIGLLTVVVTLLVGGVIMVHWSRVQSERVASARRREEIVDLMTRAGERALDPDPAASLSGLRQLGALYDERAVDPEDHEFLEEIANVVITARLDDAPTEEPLVLGTDAGVQEVQNPRIVLPNELLAAMLAVAIATTQGREASPLAHRIANASPSTDPPTAGPEQAPLKRTA